MTARFSLTLPQRQARLVALAVGYHLARPGAELDRETLQEYEHGLAEVPAALEPQLSAESATLELSSLQVTLLATAMSSVVSELKMYSTFDAMAGESGRPRSTATGFDERLRALFPEVAAEPAAADALAGEMTMLRRELPLARARELIEEARRAAAERARTGKKRWRTKRVGIDLDAGEHVLKEGSASLTRGFAPSGKLYLTNRRLHWKRARFDFVFGGPRTFDIRLSQIDSCYVRGLGFYALFVETTDTVYDFFVRAGALSPVLIFHRKTAEQWRAAILEAKAATGA